MGKLTNSVEIIPIDDPTNTRTPLQRSKMNRMSPYISDPSIIPRVQKYLENVESTYISISTMADELQNMYPEYRKRKRSAFRGSVKKAYSIVLNNYGRSENPSDSDLTDSSVDDVEDNEQYADNSINNQILQMYKNAPKQPRPTLDIDDELIDISSDDDETQNNPNANNHPANGPSTSKAPQYGPPPPLTVPEKDTAHVPILASALAAKKTKKRPFEGSQMSVLNKRKKTNAPKESHITFKDVGGMDKVLEDVCKLLIHIKHPEVYKQIGISSPRGFLLHGPPGCGKTLLAHAIAGELAVPLLKVAAPELVAGVSGESEERIRELFERAVTSSPCVLFIDEIDAITGNRQNAQKPMEHRIVAQLLSCLDDLGQNENGDRVLVIGATNSPDSLDPALRRAGRFDREVCLGIPNATARIQILKVLTSNLKLDAAFDFVAISNLTPGFVGADLLALTREAAMAAVNRVFSDLQKRQLENKTKQQKHKNERLEKITEKEALQQQQQHQAKEVTAVDGPAKGDDVEDDVIIDPGTIKENESVAPAPAAASRETTNDSTVVIIDDGADDPKETLQNGHAIAKNEPKSKVALLPTPELKVECKLSTDPCKPKTVLEELMEWLQDQQPPLTNDQLSNLHLQMDDFHIALKCVQPSAKREGFATVPDTTWDDVGSLLDVREELQMAILAPVRHPEKFEALGLTTPTGILLCGPPGCGKTLLAKAVANEAGINFISVKGPELLNMYVGESERAVRVCFQRARNSAPCVIFFDELDALCPKRSESHEGGTNRVVNQLLTEMDGIESRQGVFVMAASNRPDIIDAAVLRPGRLDKILYVGLPLAQDRVDILRALTKNGTKPPLAPDVYLDVLASSDLCEGYTGADLAALVREAGILALKESIRFGVRDQTLVVTNDNFTQAVAKIRPSVSEKDQKHYEKLRKIYSNDKKLAVAALPAPELESGGFEEMELS